MAAAGLQVIISADAKELTQAMLRAKGDVKKFEDELKKLPSFFGQADRAISKTSRQLNNAGNAVRKSRGDFTNLSRVIQDLPFGFIGVQNNLTQLIPGVGLLGVAFSGLVTALTFSQVGLSNWSRGGKEASKAADAAKKKAEEWAQEQAKLKQAFDDAASSIIGQTTRIEDLGKALVDTSNKTQLLTDATLKQGLAQLLFSKKEALVQQILADSLEEKLKFEQMRLKLIQNQWKEQKKISDLKPIRIASEQELKAAGIGLNSVEQQVFDLNKLAQSLGLSFDKFVDAPRSSSETDKFFTNLMKRVRAFEKAINDKGIRIAKFEVIPDELKSDTIKRAQEFIQNAINQRHVFPVNPKLVIEAPTVTRGGSYFASLSKEADKLLKDLQNEINKLTARNPILIRAQQIDAEIKSRNQELASILGLSIEGINAPVSFLSDIHKNAALAANNINQLLTPAFQDLFSAIKAGENPMRAFFGGLEQALNQVIQKLLAAVVQAAILSAIFPSGIGGVQGFGGFFKNILGFRAEGGPVFSGKPYVVGEKGPELFIPQGGGRIIPNNEMNSGLAGIAAPSSGFVAETMLRGNDLAILISRTSAFKNRNV